MKNTNLIAISGKAGSGKDTVAKIIQLITSTTLTNEQIATHIEIDSLVSAPKYRIKKFAYPLKNTAGMLLNIPFRYFEDQEFKDSTLSDEWTKYTLHVLDNDKLVQSVPNYSSRQDAVMAGYFLKRDVYVDSVTFEIERVPVKARDLLVMVGDALRQNVHKNVFVNALFSSYVPATDYWIISDLRFKNEAEAVLERQGILLRIESSKKTGDHPSETELDDFTFDYVIQNTGSILHLVHKTREFCYNLSIEENL